MGLKLKLESLGIHYEIRDWTSDFLDDMRRLIRLNVSLLFGVPRGTIFGPLLFLRYVSESPTVEKLSVLLFADETKTSRLVHSMSDKIILQDDLNSLFP